MEKSSFFNNVNGDRKYKASDFAEFFNSLVTNGVFPNPSTNLQVVSNGDMTVTLKAGKAWINGYVYINTSDLILSIDTADGVYNRIDRLVLRLDTVGRAINAVVKKGEFASSPVAKTLERDADIYELGIEDIAVNKGASSITQSDITDLRMNTELCGWVDSLIQADTTAIFNQYQDWYNTKKTAYDIDFTNWTTTKKADYDSWTAAKKQAYDNWYDATTSTAQTNIDNIEQQFQTDFTAWFDNIKNTLGSDIAGNLLNLINIHKGDRSNPHGVTVDQIGAASKESFNEHEAEKATADTLGHIKVGDGLSIDENGTVKVASSGLKIITKIDLTSAVSTIDFSSLGLENYKYIKVIFAGVGNTDHTYSRMITMRFNGDSGGNYYWCNSDYYNTGGSWATAQTYIPVGMRELLSPYLQVYTIDITNIVNQRKFITANGWNSYKSYTEGNWNNTALINQITFGVTGGSFAGAGSIILLGV